MTAPQAQTKLSEIHDYINQYNGVVQPNKLELQRWLKDAQELRASDPFSGYMMEGLVYRAQGKLEKGLEYLSKAYRLDWFLAGNNYASLLAMNGQYEESEKVSLKLIKTNRADSSFLIRLLLSVNHTLNTDNLAKAIDLFIATNPEANKLLEEAKMGLSSFDHILSTLNLANVSTETYSKFWSVATKVRNTSYMGSSDVSLNHQCNELGDFLIIEESLYNTSIEDCLRMNDELVDALIEDDYPFEEYQKIIFDFVPADEAVEAV